MDDRSAVFVDTGAWIALTDLRDRWHEPAERVMRQLRRERRPLVTSNLILIETCTSLVGRIQRTAIGKFRDAILSSGLTRLVRVDESLEELAWALFLRYDDKNVSVVDCTSFAIMEQLGLAHAFTFDRHFAQTGFETLPRLL